MGECRDVKLLSEWMDELPAIEMDAGMALMKTPATSATTIV